MKHYIVYTVLSLTMFYLAIGDLDRMSRTLPTKSRVIPLDAYIPKF
jgi:hypothetical protein